MGFNTTIIFAQRFWQALSGVISVVLIAHFLSPVQQGWYYSFLSLAGVFTLFDLGLSVILVNFSAHYFSKNKWLKKGWVDGDNSKHFLSLLSQSTRLYLFLSIVFCCLMVPAGLIFFGFKSTNIIKEAFDWKMPWLLLVIATSLNLLTLPFMAILEGSGLISEVYSIRLLQGVLGSFGFWLILVLGGGLWSSTIIPLFAFSVAISWLLLTKPNLFKNSWNKNKAYLVWSNEIWPLQWRVALGWFSGYMLTQIYTPILFYYQGAEVAGRMGLSLIIANMLGVLAQSWIARRVPMMANAVSRKDWKQFDSIFKEDFTFSVIAYLLGAFALCSLHYLLSSTLYSQRILPFLPFLGLLFVVLVNHVNGALAVQLRSYKKEPLVWASLAGTILTVPVAFIAAAYYSVGIVVASILSIQLTLTLPLSVYLWMKYNKALRIESNG